LDRIETKDRLVYHVNCTVEAE